MKEGVLFEITKENLETGLRGYPVGYTTTSYVDPMKGLFYRDKPISQLAFKTPEEVIYLIYYGKEPKASELESFKKELQTRAELPEALIKHIRALPRNAHPMKLFASALLMAGVDEKGHDYQEAGLNLIARIPLIVASVFNHHAGWGETKLERDHKGYIENFVSLLNLPHAKTEELVHVMRLFNILHYDHGGGNLSTFVAKATASSLEDMYGSIASGMLALEGPRHGRANQDCLEFVESIRKEVGDNPDAQQVEVCIRKRLEGGLVFGFGHAVLRVEDARASILYDFAAKKYASHPLVKLALLLRQVGTKVLSENPKISDPYPNVDAISGIVLVAAGFNYPEYFPVLFGMSRVVGISRQIIYERLEARAGKGTPIVRPKYFYVGRDDVSG